MMTGVTNELPSGIDPRLWIRTPACGERDFLLGNSHTFLGRMAGYCPHRDQGFSVSKNELIETSAEASFWVEGFLRGNEPGYPDEPGNQEAWRRALGEFYRAGVGPLD